MGIKKPVVKKTVLKILGTPSLAWTETKLYDYLAERLPDVKEWDSYQQCYDLVSESDNRVQDLLDHVREDFEREALDFCCAYDVIGEFGRTFGSLKYHDKEVTFSMLVAAVAHNIRTECSSAVLATTIPSQKDAIKMLQALGFKPLTTTLNKGTRNTVTLWQINL